MPRPRSEGRPRRLVLIVEDHPDTQSAVAEVLEDLGWDVAVASDGDLALHIMRDRRPDVVYLDLNLPHISGYEVCEEMRTDPALRNIPVVMTSARVTVDVRANSLEAGADVYVAKPYDVDHLVSLMEDLLASRSAV